MRVADVDLNLLVVLDSLLTERNVTRAAQRLGSTQPSCSRALARLRELFADPLLIRVGHDMQLTPKAEILAPQVREVVAAADRALHATIEFHPATGSRDVTICCSDYLTLVLMAPLVRRLRHEAPGVHVHLLPYHPDAFDLLRRNTIDFIVEPASFRDLEGLHSSELFRDRWQLVLWAGSASAGAEIGVEQLRAAPYLAYLLGVEQIPNLADRALHERGIRPVRTVSTGNFALVPALLIGTDMVSMMAERGARMLAAQYELELREPPVAIPELVQMMHWSPRSENDPAHQWMRATLTEVAAAI
ncbi:MAG: LysR substrate-binding domain-containing protein [Ilumatobacteraceae bacterium]